MPGRRRDAPSGQRRRVDDGGSAGREGGAVHPGSPHRRPRGPERQRTAHDPAPHRGGRRDGQRVPAADLPPEGLAAGSVDR